jgi:hypothetical protein
MKKWIAMAAGLVLFSVSARADVGVTLKASTLGFGGDVTVPLVASNANLRVGYNWFSLDVITTMDEAECEAGIRWQTVPILFDWHPAQDGFRISAGLVINGNKVALSSEPTRDYEVTGASYDILGLNGDITFDDTAWYFGIGCGNAALAEGRLRFSCDVGVMFQGTPRARASARAADPAFQSALNADVQEEVDDLQDDLNTTLFYPIISLGISFAL